MSEGRASYLTAPIEPSDATSGFSCGKHALDDYLARHALTNNARGVARAYVLRRRPDDQTGDPHLLGFYTLSMSLAESAMVAEVLKQSLPKYPMPVALIGRLAVDRRAQGRGIGSQLLIDALRRVVDAAKLVGCTGVIVDAKDADAERFYAGYDFTTVTAGGWPRRMFLPIGIARAAFQE